MSKSLKNFTTIRAALAQPEWTARSLRICFLLGSWADGIEVTEDLMKATASWEGKLNNFFIKSLDAARNSASPAVESSTEDAPADDKALLGALEKAKADLDAALCDSFNTPLAMRVISDLVTEVNLAKRVSDETRLTIARWMVRIVTIFGLDAEGDLSKDRIAWSGVEIPAAAQAYIYPASQLRDKVRQLARSGTVDHAAIAKLADETKVPTAQQTSEEASKPYADVLQQFRQDVDKLAAEKGSVKDILTLCDQLRDTYLWSLDIYLEDRDPPLPAIVRPVDRTLREARAERDSAAAAKAAAKLKKETDEAEKKRLLGEKAKVSHLEMFRTSEYSEWDADGVPLKDAAGEDVSKSKRKKMVKDWEKQKKMHEDWLATNQ
jgi:cysteinyl-tRNA synthetase